MFINSIFITLGGEEDLNSNKKQTMQSSYKSLDILSKHFSQIKTSNMLYVTVLSRVNHGLRPPNIKRPSNMGR